MKHLGFTGTQRGMTEFQFQLVDVILLELLQLGFATLHHGLCIGADAQAHKIARAWSRPSGQPGRYEIHGHPANIWEKQQANLDCDVLHPIAEPLNRNRVIAHTCDLLLATPAELTETLRSGTWATIRYAREYGKPIIIIPPIPS